MRSRAEMWLADAGNKADVRAAWRFSVVEGRRNEEAFHEGWMMCSAIRRG